MSEAEARAVVVAEALTWLGTPWRHRGRVKGVGVDCGQLPLAVFAACGLIPRVETGAYPRDWHLHRDYEWYLAFVGRFCREIAPARAEPADLVVFRIGRLYSHGAIVVGDGRGVHACVSAGEVVLCDLDRDGRLCDRPRRAFTLKEW